MSNIKTYTLNLNDEPNIRWKHILMENKEACRNTIDELEKLILSQVSVATYNILYYTINYLTPKSYIRYYDELLSISEILEVSFDKIVIGQLCYELFAACTAITCEYNNDQTFFRTMDWPLECLKDITIHLNVVKDGKQVYQGVTWIGYVGILTGMKPYKYALAVNFRRSDGSLYDNILKVLNMKWPISYLCREILESDYDLDKIKDDLENFELISPCYIILCGIEKSHVIIRDSNSCKQILSSDKYLIQTNKDPDGENNIMFSNERFDLAKKIINKNKENFINDFKQYPIINQDTIYYTIMIPSKNKLITNIILN